MAKTLPPFHAQETDFSCAVACLRMVLESFGVTKSESELRELCDCTIFGTSAVELIQAARRLGFRGSRKYSLTIDELRRVAEEGYFPIVYVVLVKSSTADVLSLVVTSVSDDAVRVLDPERGLSEFSVGCFRELWAPINNLAVVIAR